jgi:hypothetical protein
MALMPISEARDACNFEFFILKFTANNDGSYREGNIMWNISTIPAPFISEKDSEENPSAKYNVINNIVIILESAEFKHQWNIRTVRDCNWKFKVRMWQNTECSVLCP